MAQRHRAKADRVAKALPGPGQPPALNGRRAAPAKGRPLSDRRERFVNEYLKCLNATLAYKRAGYTCQGIMAHVAVNRILADPVVSAEIDSRLAVARREADVTAPRVLRELAAIAYANIYDFGYVDELGNFRMDLENVSREQAAAIDEIEYTPSTPAKYKIDDSGEPYVAQDAEPPSVRKFKLLDKLAALKTLAMITKLTQEPNTPGAVSLTQINLNVDCSPRDAAALYAQLIAET